MRLTSEQETRLRLLADGKLYREAVGFANEQQAVIRDRQFGNQINGLLAFSRSWDEVRKFVDHQRKRTWTGRRKAYQEFYGALHTYLEGLRGSVKDDHGFVPDGLTRDETGERTDLFAGHMARAFIQHLAAEMMWQKEV